MNRRIPVILIILLALFPFMNVPSEVLLAGASVEHVFGDEELIPSYPVVARIKIAAIIDPNAKTNGNPPKLRITIVDFLRGSLNTTLARWRPFPHDIDYVGGDSESRLAAWKSKPRQPPEIGSDWIVCGKIRNDTFWIAPRCRFPYSEKKWNWAREALIKGIPKWEKERLRKVQSQLTGRKGTAERIEDLGRQLEADLVTLFRNSTDVVIGQQWQLPPSEENQLLFSVEWRMKDSSDIASDPKHSLCVDVPEAAKQMMHYRMGSDDGPLRMVLFLRRTSVAPEGLSKPVMKAVGGHLFEFADLKNGLLPLTQDREDVLKLILQQETLSASPDSNMDRPE